MTDTTAAVALAFRRSHADTQAILDDLEAQGIHVVFRAVTGDLCPCGYHYATESGLCLACEAAEAALEKADEIAAERKRLEAEFVKMINRYKTAKKRERARFFANPRDSENRERWRIARELFDDIEESLDRPDWNDTDDSGFDEEDG